MTNKYNSLNGRKFKKVKFRLPTELEWMLASNPLPGHGLPWYGESPYSPESLKKKGDIKSLANLKVYDKVEKRYMYGFDGAIYTSPVGFYGKTQNGLCDIIGNASELTLEGKIKGGSWDNTIKESFVDKAQDYQIPDPRVGFRIVMIVIE